MEIIFATNNSYKFQEIRDKITSSIKLLSLADIGFFDNIPETHDTLEENASEKAFHIYKRFQKNCFADDTGLEIEALNSAPGVLSARYAGDNASFEDNMNKVLKHMEGMTNRKARFRTVISLIEEGEEIQFQGAVNGEIMEFKQGDNGFGYDPIFKPAGFDITFAQMTLNEKNEISHRGIAVNKLITYLNSKY